MSAGEVAILDLHRVPGGVAFYLTTSSAIADAILARGGVSPECGGGRHRGRQGVLVHNVPNMGNPRAQAWLRIVVDGPEEELQRFAVPSRYELTYVLPCRLVNAGRIARLTREELPRVLTVVDLMEAIMEADHARTELLE